MTGTVYTPLLGQINKRQYPVTQDQLSSILAGVNVVTSVALSNYVLTSTLISDFAKVDRSL